MKTAFEILKRDLAALIKNPIALLVVGALLVLPGLYAWYCIVANWDPYANTGNLPIAIVNKDRGVTSAVAGEVDVGGQVSAQLRDNDSIDWRFYDDEQEALEDTRLGVCYAAIVFPEDLSENLVGTITGADARPAIDYYPNEKYNAVAVKVADSAAQTLIRQINQNFSSTVNKTILARARGVSDQMGERAEEVHGSVLTDIQAVQEDLRNVIASLDDAKSSIAGWKDAAAGASAALVATNEQLPAIRGALDAGSADLESLRGKTIAFEAGLTKSILDSSKTVSNLSSKTATTLSTARENLETIKARFSSLADSMTDADLKSSVKTFEDITALIDDMIGRVDSTVSDIDARVQGVTDDVTNATNALSSDVMPPLNSGTASLSSSLGKLSGAMGQFEPQINQLINVLAQTDSALDQASASLADAQTLLARVESNLGQTVTDLGTIRSAFEVDKITELLHVDSDNVGTFISSPVEMDTHVVYDVSNYGTAVAPFYTNLALWVGCFILASLMRVEVDRKNFEHATTTQLYFGRWLLFVILSLLQSQVICGVDLLIGIDCANPAAFMAAGAVCSFAYMNLIFALVIMFRNIGKTLCILLLIMQVPGSSGMYPIELMPAFFQGVHPFLPFTYGIDAMREALCGMYDNRYFIDLLVLSAIVPVSLLLGVYVRPALMGLTQLFDTELGKTGFFGAEEHGQQGYQRMRALMRLLRSDDNYRDGLEERSWRFNRRYPALRRAGDIVLFGIPVLFLVLMLPLNAFAHIDVDLKLRLLVTMIALLFIVQLALIMLEFVNRTIAEETKLLGESLIDDDLLADLAKLKETAESAEVVEGDGEPDGGTLQSALDEAGETASTGNLAMAAEDEKSEGDAGVTADEGVESADRRAYIPLATHPEESIAEVEPALATVDESATTDIAAAPAKRRRGVTRDIFITDMRLGFQSVIGAVVIMLLVITPSLYAWFNIAGSWDPYGNTGNLKVAVANEDEGYKGELVPVTINIGDTIVSQLRGNEGFQWEFTSKEDAVEGVENGSYYASIEIPSDFSRNMLTYLTDDTAYPQVVYYTNKKENPIAPIITQKGADSIKESIRVSFTERVDQVVLSVAYEVLSYATDPRVNSYVAKMSSDLDNATHDMKSGANELSTLANLSNTVGGIVDTTGTTLEGVRTAGESAKGAIAEAVSGVDNASAAFKRALDLTEDIFGKRQLDISGIQNVIDAAMQLLQAGAEGVPDLIQGAIDDVKELRDGSKGLTKAQKAEFNAVIDSLKAAKKNSSKLSSNIEESRAEGVRLIKQARAELDNAKAYFNDSVKPALSGVRDSLGNAADSTRNIVSGLESAIDGVAGSTDGLSSQLGSLAEGLSKASERLNSGAGNIEAAKNRLVEALASGDVATVKAIVLGSDPETMSEHLAQPVVENREAMYPVSNYGSAMAPFYTVLSLWVGALVMISTMRVHVVKERVEELRQRFAKVRPRHEFFGRYGIFSLIGLMQSSLVLLGDLFFLNIQCVHPLLFFLFGLFIGQVFCLIVFTLTDLFGDVGKALCVILLIMQVAASGGTFPAEMFHPLLTSIVEYLPFYHAMSLLQECVAGISWLSVFVWVSALIGVVGIMLMIALPLRRPFRKLTDFFEEQLEKTGYM